MSDIRQPQTDREWLMKVSGQIGVLSDNFDLLAKKLVDIEEKKIADHEKRIRKIEDMWQQIMGGWKLWAAVWSLIVILAGWVLKYITK